MRFVVCGFSGRYRSWQPWLRALAALVWWGVAAACSAAEEGDSAYARTRYPIVLAHGLSGFSEIGPVEYWNGIAEDLRKHGAVVFVSQVSAFNASEVRGEQLLQEVHRVLAMTGAKKVHLIGHSHGSQSCRYVAALRPDLVASVTSVSGPNAGSPVADWFDRLSRAVGPWLTSIGASAFNGLGHALSSLSGPSRPQDAVAGMRSLTKDGAADFNRRFPAGVPPVYCGAGAPEVAGVRYYSWSGVGRFYRAVNPFDYLMVVTGWAFDDPDNDGLVHRCSSHLGLVLRDDYPMNHVHAINHLWSLVGEGVDPVALYRLHAHRLKNAGL